MNYNFGNNLRNNYNMNTMNTWNDPAQQLGFVGVQNENEARAFPVALGNSVTFRDESQPNTFYTKTMGNSPLERPIFEKYRLVKENAEPAVHVQEGIQYALKSDLDAIKKEIESLKVSITTGE